MNRLLARIIHEALSDDRKGTVKAVPFRPNQGTL
jgi:hypothetical protein